MEEVIDMVKGEGTTITMTRGDTLEVPVVIKTADGEDFVPAAGDIIRFAWKDNPEKHNMKGKNGLPASPFEIEVK